GIAALVLQTQDQQLDVQHVELEPRIDSIRHAEVGVEARVARLCHGMGVQPVGRVGTAFQPEKSLEQVILGELGEPRLILNQALNALRQGFGFVAAVELLNW
ncbi:hypothetical protein, partial [Klebsiella pneumoniae]|uniref:hypothetical protein n=1 Tax=Klebsiella pneumoniae TaxID=573 RepID=UPI002108DD8B